ncbi:hypothetical protein BCF33_1216 [Hasllibacter halocynthiae]|uniref:Uncharacterized protein n=1 Tax=Hasllibacter halocynthiae TaxID=595589 RepID=A0A2T0X9Q1_9RHOB|nr:hypothetical protein BCF33_1216 [Hasllibacter halocynthiae]
MPALRLASALLALAALGGCAVAEAAAVTALWASGETFGW